MSFAISALNWNTLSDLPSFEPLSFESSLFYVPPPHAAKATTIAVVTTGNAAHLLLRIRIPSLISFHLRATPTQ
jgi:hypothetical protein